MKPHIYIGTANIEFDLHGKVITAVFIPAAHQINIEQLENNLRQIEPITNLDEVQNHAQLVLADYFNHIDRLESAVDYEHEIIVPDVISQTKWPNGKPQFCQIRFTMVQR